MRQAKGHGLLYNGLMVVGISILALCAGFFVWKFFQRTPTITFVPNTRELTMQQMLEKEFGEYIDEKELTYAQLKKMRYAYAGALKIDGPMNKLEKYQKDHRSDGVWQTGSSVIKCYIFTDNVISSPEYYRKYIR